MDPKVSKRRDLIGWETHPGYTRESALLHNKSGTARTVTRDNFIGTLVKADNGDTALAFAADSDSIAGVIVAGAMGDQTLAATTGVSEREFAVLVRGPAIVRRSALATHDPAGDPYNGAQVEASLAAMGIIVRDDSEEVETQTT